MSTVFNCPFGHWLCDPKNTISIFGILMCIIEMAVMSFYGYRYFHYRRHIVLRKRFIQCTIFVYWVQMLKELSWICLLTNNLLIHNNSTTIPMIHELVWRAIRIPVRGDHCRNNRCTPRRFTNLVIGVTNLVRGSGAKCIVF